MKDALLPPVRVDEELRNAAESVLDEGESLSSFIEAAVRRAVDYRRIRTEFHAAGQAALERYRRTGGSRSADEVLGKLQKKLDARRKQLER
jgi:hypothetical protein